MLLPIQIKKLASSDLETFIELVYLFEEVFEMKEFVLPSETHLRNILQKSNFIAFVASLDNKVIGGLTVYTLDQYYSERPLAYIYDLAVKKEYQRKGVGKQLIESVKDYCKKEGFEEVFVQADKVDDYAIDFYRATGITEEEQVVHFYYSLNKR